MAKEDNLEFGIEYIRHEANRIFVAGRCYKGPISIGDVFNSVYQLIPQKNEEGYSASKLVNSRPVDIYVVSMKAYSHELEKIYEGLTAELEIAGEGCDIIKPGDVLGRLT